MKRFLFGLLPVTLLVVASLMGQTSYPVGTRLRLTALPDAGAQFDGWSGDASGTQNPIEIVLDADASVTATFSPTPPPPPQDPTLTINVVGPGSVNVVVVPPAPVCGNGMVEPPEQCDDGNTTSGDGCSATCQTETPPPGGDLAGGEWKAIAGSEMNSIYDPAIDQQPGWPANSFANIQLAWGGAACNEATDELIVWGGGHNDSAHNGVFAVNVLTGVWRRVTQPSPIWQNSNPANPNYCPSNVCSPPAHDTSCAFGNCNVGPDGAPISRHTYGSLAVIDNYLYSVNGAVYPGGGSGELPNGWRLDLTTGQWTPMPAAGTTASYSVAMEGRTIRTFNYQWGANSFDIDTGLWAPSSLDGQYVNHDTRLIIAGGKYYALGDGRAWVSSPGTAWSNGLATDLGSVGHLTQQNGPGAIYYPPEDLILLWSGGQTIETIKVSDDSWGTVTPSGVDPGPALAPSGNQATFGRFNYCGGRVVLLNGVNKPLYWIDTTQSQASNFEERCNASGVVFCDPLDSEGPWGLRADGQRHLMPNPGGSQGVPTNLWWQNWRGVQKGGAVASELPAMDASTKASGSGSLRFSCPSPSGSDCGGTFTTNFSDDVSQQFGEGDTFYVQYRIRHDCDYIYLDCNPASPNYRTTRRWYRNRQGVATVAKLSITATGDTTPNGTMGACTFLEMVANYRADHHLAGYHSCIWFASFAKGTGENFFGSFQQDFQPNGSVLGQADQNLPTCWWIPNPAVHRFSDWGYIGPACWQLEADEWATIQMMVRIGTWQNDRTQPPNSHVTIWAAHEGDPQQVVIDMDIHVHTPDAPGQKFGKIWFGPYMEGKDPAEVHPISHLWYDELIVSRNFITDPT